MNVPIIDTSSNEETIIETSNYHLTYDKVRREIVPSQRDDYACLEFYTLNVARGLKNSNKGSSWRHSKASRVKDS